MSNSHTLFLTQLEQITGPNGVLTSEADKSGFLTELRDRYQGQALAVVRPGSTDEVSRIVRLCAEENVPIVPQGGNTGLVGGQIPDASGQAIVLSLTRMKSIRAIDTANSTMIAEAGVTLTAVQRAAEQRDLLFPLSIASEGTATVGGILSTNAGGVAVLKYGNARALCLGLEVVLPSGEVWSSLSGLYKDNTGYDLKQLFIGGEGTLGVITAASLRLFPRHGDTRTALAAVPDPEAAVSLLSLAKVASGDQVTAFELIPRIGIEFVLRHREGAMDPLGAPHPWYVLIEVSSGRVDGSLQTILEEFLADAMEKQLLSDAVIASSGDQAGNLWGLREGLSECQKPEGGSIKHDISVPVSAMARFITEACQACEAHMPGIRPVPFGHIGDGNVHFNLSQPPGMDKAEFLSHWQQINDIVHGIAARLGGSISAEHGIGQMKVDEITRYKTEPELAMMRAVKQALDPQNLMNPGKLIKITS